MARLEQYTTEGITIRHLISSIILVLAICSAAALSAQPHEGQKGDVNNDGSINVLDMLSIANHILGIAHLDEDGIWRADVNGPVGNFDGDGSVNVLDMVKTANIILGIDEYPPTPCMTVTDIDGNKYQTVQIGDQCWMAENLKVARYHNGDPIPDVTDNTEWSILTTGAYCNYNNDTTNVATYGRLYNWYAVIDSRDIAPEGWHVPTDDEWKQLEMYLGMSQSDADDTGTRGTDEGGRMKATGTITGDDGLWSSPNTGATNETGFSALPGGYRYNGTGSFSKLGYDGYFWSSTEISNSYLAWPRCLSYYNSGIYRYQFQKQTGFSVRCVKN